MYKKMGMVHALGVGWCLAFSFLFIISNVNILATIVCLLLAFINIVCLFASKVERNKKC